MSYCDTYNVQDITEKLERELKEALAYKEAWKNVTFPTKKDGKPFAVMSKNFSGAFYNSKTYGYYDYEKELVVYPKSSYATQDFIDCYKDYRELLTLDEIKEKIKDRIKYWNDRADAIKTEIENAEKAYNEFYNAFKEAIEQLKKTSGYDAERDLFYLVRDTVIEHNKY